MCLHACRASKDCTDHAQLALHKTYRNKGCKNVSHKNKQRCRDGAVCLSNTSVPVWKNLLAEKVFRNKEGYHSMQLPMQVNRLQDTSDVLSPSLHLATFWCTHFHCKSHHATICTDWLPKLVHCSLKVGVHMSWPQSLGLGNLFNVGKPLARRLLFQMPTVYIQHKHTQCLLSRGAVT